MQECIHHFVNLRNKYKQMAVYINLNFSKIKCLLKFYIINFCRKNVPTYFGDVFDARPGLYGILSWMPRKGAQLSVPGDLGRKFLGASRIMPLYRNMYFLIECLINRPYIIKSYPVIDVNLKKLLSVFISYLIKNLKLWTKI